jgi:hypothetical protein
MTWPEVVADGIYAAAVVAVIIAMVWSTRL